MKKRSQAERLTIAESLVSSVWEEVADDNVENMPDVLQLAVNIQVDVNRIVWRLNQMNNEGKRKEKYD